MSTSSIQSNEEFQCPICLVSNRASAKFCRKCGRSREALGQCDEVNHSSEVSGAKVSIAKSPEANPISNPECSSCSSTVRLADRFCCWCGESQPVRVGSTPVICRNCSQSLPLRANFCFQCGCPVAEPEKLRMRLPAELFGEETSEFFPTFEA